MINRGHDLHLRRSTWYAGDRGDRNKMALECNLLGLSPEHGTLNQYWYNVGPPSVTLAQHYTTIGVLSRVC